MKLRLLVIFLTGASILGLELIASRVMTPYFGVSLYIWAGILTITLLFLSIGYAAGGVLTRKFEAPSLAFIYSLFPSLAGLAVVAACLVYPQTFRPLATVSLIGGAFVACTMLLAVPLLLLSSLNPVLVALRTESGRAPSMHGGHTTDSGAGFVFFISTVGSIAGVLLAAFIILPYVTNFQALLVSAVILSVAGYAGVFTGPELNCTHKRVASIAASLCLFSAAALWLG